MIERILIDGVYPEEMRIAHLREKRLMAFNYENIFNRLYKGNIYLARVIHVEASLQAAFLEFKDGRHGFLAFNEIHPDYYAISSEDRKKLLKDIADEDENGVSCEGDSEDAEAETFRMRRQILKSYKIKDVIKKGQVMLVQIVKDERQNKGAALTTYLSLAGRYCILMPNTPRGANISRKIVLSADRKKLRDIIAQWPLPEGMGVIVRTAGLGRNKTELKRDYDYVMRLWSEIREKTLSSSAPSLIHEEGDILTRTLRDHYTRDIEEVLVEGKEAYKRAKILMRMLVPSHARKIKQYTPESSSIFQDFGVEEKISSIHDPVVTLPSGGSIVIAPTEALVAIDVNSGRSTRERNIEDTAFKTNLEAAEEVARQLELRDLSGLIVVDFIDMNNKRHNAQVEKRMQEALRKHRARTRVGSISQFGLLELSRQRLRNSLIETSSMPCPHCRGSGTIRSVEAASLHVLRSLQMRGITGEDLRVVLPRAVALHILNNKRETLVAWEKRNEVSVSIGIDESLIIPDFRLEDKEKEASKPSASKRSRSGARETSSLGKMILPSIERSDLSSPEVRVDKNLKNAHESEDNTEKERKDGSVDTFSEKASSGNREHRRSSRRGGHSRSRSRAGKEMRADKKDFLGEKEHAYPLTQEAENEDFFGGEDTSFAYEKEKKLNQTRGSDSFIFPIQDEDRSDSDMTEIFFTPEDTPKQEKRGAPSDRDMRKMPLRGRYGHLSSRRRRWREAVSGKQEEREHREPVMQVSQDTFSSQGSRDTAQSPSGEEISLRFDKTLTHEEEFQNMENVKRLEGPLHAESPVSSPRPRRTGWWQKQAPPLKNPVEVVEQSNPKGEQGRLQASPLPVKGKVKTHDSVLSHHDSTLSQDLKPSSHPSEVASLALSEDEKETGKAMPISDQKRDQDSRSHPETEISSKSLRVDVKTNEKSAENSAEGMPSENSRKRSPVRRRRTPARTSKKGEQEKLKLEKGGESVKKGEKKDMPSQDTLDPKEDSEKKVSVKTPARRRRTGGSVRRPRKTLTQASEKKESPDGEASSSQGDRSAPDLQSSDHAKVDVI